MESGGHHVQKAAEMKLEELIPFHHPEGKNHQKIMIMITTHTNNTYRRVCSLAISSMKKEKEDRDHQSPPRTHRSHWHTQIPSRFLPYSPDSHPHHSNNKQCWRAPHERIVSVFWVKYVSHLALPITIFILSMRVSWWFDSSLVFLNMTHKNLLTSTTSNLAHWKQKKHFGVFKKHIFAILKAMVWSSSGTPAAKSGQHSL